MNQLGGPHGQGPLQGPVRGMTIVMAVMSVFLAAPDLFGLSHEFVQGLVERNYGTGFEKFVAVAWAALVGFFVFYAAQLGFMVGATFLATSIFMKLMPFAFALIGMRVIAFALPANLT